eukprot:5124566-Amphidinium_carterae.1
MNKRNAVRHMSKNCINLFTDERMWNLRAPSLPNLHKGLNASASKMCGSHSQQLLKARRQAHTTRRDDERCK